MPSGMDVVVAYHRLIEQLCANFGIGDQMLHVHVGLGLYLGAQLVLRNRRASFDALLLVVCAELTNELLDRLFLGHWDWPDTISDVVATLFWPTLVYAIGRYRRQRWQRREAYLRQGAALLTAIARRPLGTTD